MNNRYLVHHGIKGQKWGVRRFENPDGTLTEAGKERYSKSKNEDPVEAEKKRKREQDKNRGTLSDEELAAAIKRLRMEKELHDLTNSQVNSGKVFVTDIMRDLGKKVAVTAGAGAILYGLKTVISKEFDLHDFGEAVFNGGAKKKK